MSCSRIYSAKLITRKNYRKIIRENLYTYTLTLIDDKK